MALRYLVSTLALATSLTTIAPAVAQTAPAADAMQPTLGEDKATPADPAESSEIMVTGTRLSRPNLKAASPIVSVTAAEIKAQGAVNIEEVLNRFPQIAPDSQQTSPISNGKQRVKLRSVLDNLRTLPLINGQRMAGGESIDTNVIPIALIDRIDILTGGASSVYGSDAITGVVNYIIKKDFTGLQLAGNFNFYNHKNRENASTPVAQAWGAPVPANGYVNDGGRINLSATYGRNFLDNRLNVSIFGEYRHAEPILLGDRDISGCQLRRDTSNPLRVNNLICGGTAASPNGTLTINGVNYSNVTGSPGTFALASTVPTYTDRAERPSARGYDRINAGGFVNFKASPAFEFAGSLLYLRDKSENSIYGPFIGAYNGVNAAASTAGYTGAPYLVNCNNPLLSAWQATTICGANAGTSAYAPLNIQYAFPNLVGDRDREKFTNTQTRFTASVRGEIAEGFKYDVGGVYTENRDIWTFGGVPSFTKIQAALDVVNVNGVPTCRNLATNPGCVPLDVFRANNPGSPALVSYLFNEPEAYMDTQAKFYDVTANLTVDFTRFGITSPLAEQGLAIAIGTEYRKQRQEIYRNRRYTEVFGTTSITTGQDVKEANIEAQLPLIQNIPGFKLLQVNGGYRLSKYDINPNTFDTWKIEAIYSPIPDVTLRFSKNRAARAPGVNEDGQLISFATYPLNDPCASVNGAAPRASIQACRASGLADSLYGSATLSCPDNSCRERRNGFEIAPEDARTVTYGVVFTPVSVPGLSLSIDYYEIQVNNVITFAFADFAINGCVLTADPYYCSRLVRNPNGTLFGASTDATGFVQAGLSNAYRLHAAGYDFQAQYSVTVPPLAGRLDFLFNGSETTDAGGQNAVNQPRYNCAGFFGGSCGQPIPKWTHVFRASYASENKRFNGSLAWRYIGGTLAGQNGGPNATAASVVTDFTNIPAYNYFDLAIGMNIGKGISLNAAMNNTFDKMPPVLTNSNEIAASRGNTVPQRYDVFGRTISLGITARF